MLPPDVVCCSETPLQLQVSILHSNQCASFHAIRHRAHHRMLKAEKYLIRPAGNEFRQKLTCLACPQKSGDSICVRDGRQHTFDRSHHQRLAWKVQGDGDVVVATALEGEPGEVRIAAITGDGGRLPLDAAKNCVGIAAAETLKLLEAVLGPLSAGVSLHLDKARCSCSRTYISPLFAWASRWF